MTVANPPGYERQDIRLRPVIWFGVALLAAAIVIHLVLAVALDLMGRGEIETKVRVSPLEVRGSPERPEIEYPSVRDQMAELRRHEARTLGSYDWVDREAEVVRIPIERAMDLLVERGGPEFRSKEEHR